MRIYLGMSLVTLCPAILTWSTLHCRPNPDRFKRLGRSTQFVIGEVNSGRAGAFSCVQDIALLNYGLLGTLMRNESNYSIPLLYNCVVSLFFFGCPASKVRANIYRCSSFFASLAKLCGLDTGFILPNCVVLLWEVKVGEKNYRFCIPSGRH